MCMRYSSSVDYSFSVGAVHLHRNGINRPGGPTRPTVMAGGIVTKETAMRSRDCLKSTFRPHQGRRDHLTQSSVLTLPWRNNARTDLVFSLIHPDRRTGMASCTSIFPRRLNSHTELIPTRSHTNMTQQTHFPGLTLGT